MPTFVAETTTNGNMKKILTIMAILLTSFTGAKAQNKELIDELNKRCFWMPYAQCLGSDDRMESFLMEMVNYSNGLLQRTRETIEEDHKRALAVLQVRKDICGKKKGKKADALLAKYFNDVEQVNRAFDNAVQAERRYNIVTEAINYRLAHPLVQSMPAGRLLLFEYSTGNGFAGYKFEVRLSREQADGPGTLLVDEKNFMRMRPDELEVKASEPVAVDDSVFVHVHDIVEQGKLYEVGRYYQPDVDIMDASNWSMYIKFEKGNIDSNGYAVGPDHSDTLNQVLSYLNILYRKLSGQGETPEKGESEP